ncbi:MAG: hypothetical protein WCQ67_03165 [Treponema sp.]
MCKKITLLVFILAAFVFASCKSTPKEETPAQTEEPAKQEEVKEEPKEEPVKSTDYSDANKALLEKVTAARESAISAGAENANPDGYKTAEVEYKAEQSACESSTDDLSIALNDLIARYNAIASYADAKSKKARIDSLGFASYGQQDYDEASTILDELSDAKSNINTGKNLYEKASSADAKFTNVLTAGFKAQSKAERTEAFKAKKQADSVKASVSRKADYDKGVEQFRSGDQKYVTGNAEESVDCYKNSREIFTTLYNEISDARAKAQAAIDAAKAKVEASNAVAEQADSAAPLGDTKVEGIEDENAKLLQDDDFSSTENTDVELDETLTEEGAEK